MLETKGGAERYESLRQQVSDALRAASRLAELPR